MSFSVYMILFFLADSLCVMCVFEELISQLPILLTHQAFLAIMNSTLWNQEPK